MLFFARQDFRRLTWAEIVVWFYSLCGRRIFCDWCWENGGRCRAWRRPCRKRAATAYIKLWELHLRWCLHRRLFHHRRKRAIRQRMAAYALTTATYWGISLRTRHFRCSIGFRLESCMQSWADLLNTFQTTLQFWKRLVLCRILSKKLLLSISCGRCQGNVTRCSLNLASDPSVKRAITSSILTDSANLSSSNTQSGTSFQ